MMATLGYLVAENFHPLFGGQISGPANSHLGQVEQVAPIFFFDWLLPSATRLAAPPTRTWDKWSKLRLSSSSIGSCHRQPRTRTCSYRMGKALCCCRSR